jgi:hypothetical protein
MVPSKTDWFSNNTEEGRKGLQDLEITKEYVNMMQADGVRGVYSDFATLRDKLITKYGENQEDDIDKLIDALTDAVDEGLLRW